MAIPTIHTFHRDWDPFDFTMKDTVIQGKLLTATYYCDEFSHLMPTHLHEKQVKQEIANYLAHRMLENNLLNFTKQPDVPMNRTIYRAYGCMVPNDRVQLLKEATKK
jgi:hypothetical protein